LAGLFSLHSNGIVTAKEAKEFIEKREWPQQKELIEDSSHTRLWKFLQEIEVKIDTPKGMKTRTIAELTEIADGGYDEDVSTSAAAADLRRKGFRAEEGFIFVSNSNSWIANKLKFSEWLGKWSHTLKSMPGACVSRHRRFVSTDRCIGIPMESRIEE